MKKEKTLLLIFISLFLSMAVFAGNTQHNSATSQNFAETDTASLDSIEIVEEVEITDNSDDSLADIDTGGDDDEEFLDETTDIKVYNEIHYEIPASDVYSVWNNSRLNPYNVNITTIKDTVMFDMCGFVYPLVKPLHITSKFGYRRRRHRHHNGIDLKLYTGDTVVSPLRGMVRITGNNGRRSGYGKYVVIRHFNGFETVYGHLSEINVEENQIIEAGDLIGLGGNTGRSTGSHLHWEFRYLGNPINPEEIIDFENHCSKEDTYCLASKVTFKHIIEQAKAKYWTVRSGDTLSKIASRTGVSIRKICSLNRISTKTLLQIGRKIRYN